MERQPTAAFVLTLLAGLWMLGAGGMGYMMVPGFSDTGGSWMWGRGMMHALRRRRPARRVRTAAEHVHRQARCGAVVPNREHFVARGVLD